MTRGIRNNNPGNIIITNIPWIGKKAQNTDGRFEQFKTLHYGCRALLMNLEGAIKIHKLNTIKKIIEAYAPPSENKTIDYCKNICVITNLTNDEIIKEDEPEKICSIAYAICCVENGIGETKNASLTKDYFLQEWKELNPC